MEILGHDHEPPVFSGPGYFATDSNRLLRFVMHGVPKDGAEAFRKIVQAQKNPYSHIHQFRVTGTAYDGTTWHGGWTALTLGDVVSNVWRLSGSISSLRTLTSGFAVAQQSSVELIFDRPLRLPIPMNMIKTAMRGDKQVLWSRSAGEKTLKVMNTDIEFSRDAEREHVWLVAGTTEEMPHPHLENWLSEPLSLLLGEIITPSLYARNFGDGTASVVFRPSNAQPATTLTASMMREDPLGADERFWTLYRDILIVVATARDDNGHPNFEAHPLTKYYWEITQAARGSNWVLCMTLASAIEGITKMMFSAAERKSEWPPNEVDGLKRVIESWDGNNDLRSRVLEYVNGFKVKGIGKTLKSLVADGIITKEQVEAWRRIRNSSMHGEMVLPWSTEEEHLRIVNLIELTHRLSAAYVDRQIRQQSVEHSQVKTSL